VSYKDVTIEQVKRNSEPVGTLLVQMTHKRFKSKCKALILLQRYSPKITNCNFIPSSQRRKGLQHMDSRSPQKIIHRYLQDGGGILEQPAECQSINVKIHICPETVPD
jgi:hypothetical protein